MRERGREGSVPRSVRNNSLNKRTIAVETTPTSESICCSHVLAALRIGGGRTAGRLAICTRRQLLTIWYGRTAGRLPVWGFWRQLLTISVAALLAELLTVKPTRGDVGSNDKLTKRCIRTTKGATRRRSIDWWWPHCWPISNLHFALGRNCPTAGRLPICTN